MIGSQPGTNGIDMGFTASGCKAMGGDDSLYTRYTKMLLYGANWLCVLQACKLSYMSDSF